MTEVRQESKSMLFVGGLMIGAVIAALLTPRNGHEMRKDVRERAMNMKDKLNNKKNELDEKKDQAAEMADDKITDVQSKLQNARDKGNTNKL